MIYDYLTIRKRGRWYYRLDGIDDYIEFERRLLTAGDYIRLKFVAPTDDPSSGRFIIGDDEAERFPNGLWLYVSKGKIQFDDSAITVRLDGVNIENTHAIPVDGGVHEIKISVLRDVYFSHVGGRGPDFNWSGVVYDIDVNGVVFPLDEGVLNSTVTSKDGSENAIIYNFNSHRWVYV